MNRLGKILTLGLEKKRAWQLPLKHNLTRRSGMKPLTVLLIALWIAGLSKGTQELI